MSTLLEEIANGSARLTPLQAAKLKSGTRVKWNSLQTRFGRVRGRMDSCDPVLFVEEDNGPMRQLDVIETPVFCLGV